ncbi:MAG: hypothetical protein EZS28_020697 [Streblomastix strix]|uniref:Uncharacterized protein n=1 Tax=Streblomastix strix TaxID=222440 RepID=A0A5J4VMS9_9EUKA|nr:MAG: hypothetical protein EZS28_020697 [Streblomastix strix]
MSVPTNAITQSPNFGLESGGQLLNKYPVNYPLPGNRHVVAYDAVSLILLPQTINFGSEPLDAKKLYRFNYELNFNFVITFGTVGSNTSVWSPNWHRLWQLTNEPWITFFDICIQFCEV